MILLKNFLNRRAVLLLACLIGLTGCARAARTPQGDAVVGEQALHVAVLPIINLSGTIAPAKDLQIFLTKGLQQRGFVILDEDALQGFMARHRMRYTGGIDNEIGRAFKEETGTDAVLITSVELFYDKDPPRISIMSRMVSTGNEQRILWMDSSSLAGDDSPGILGLGLIGDPRILLANAVQSLMDSLSESFLGAGKGIGSPEKRFKPKMAFRSPVLMLSTDMKYRVAVVPFTDLSGRKNAGEIMSLQFIGAMARCVNFEVIEPGVLRDKLLRVRVILNQGVSLANADTLFDMLDADLILMGTIFDYEDYQGALGKPRVEFTAQLLEKRSREIVWTSNSYNEGDDGVFFFDVGRISTAQKMAAQMVGLVVEMMEKK